MQFHGCSQVHVGGLRLQSVIQCISIHTSSIPQRVDRRWDQGNVSALLYTLEPEYLGFRSFRD
jgi:hypothetical protein